MAKQRSNAWYLLPIFFSIIGGLIGYFIIEKDDPKKAKRVLIVGVAVFGVALANVAVQTSVVIGSILSSEEGLLSIISPAFSLMG